MEPLTQAIQRRFMTIGQNLNITVWQVIRVAGNYQFLRFAARAVAKPKALNTTFYRVYPHFGAQFFSNGGSLPGLCLAKLLQPRLYRPGR